MKQSRGTSLLKSLVSTAVGFAVAFVANMIVMPYFGLDLSHSANFLLTCIYTVISIARGYALERIFEAMGWRTRMSAFALAVLAERQMQPTLYGYTTQHDDELKPGVLSEEASHCCIYWKEKDESAARRMLVKAGALVLAEGDRFDRTRRHRRAK